MRKKTLKQLTIRDNFMFCAVMLDSENCRRVIERVLGLEIARVDVSFEKSIVYHPEYKGVRLDVYAKDENNTHFNVEMQVVNQSIFKRARYYHSQIDMELLTTGIEYKELPGSYVIFICDFDPIGLNKYRYTIRKTLQEDGTYEYDDGERTIFLSTKGKNGHEVPKELVSFLNYIATDDPEKEQSFNDELVERLQKSVKAIKSNREMGARYMLLEEMMKDEFKAGKMEGKIESILTILSILAPIPTELEERISSLSDETMVSFLLEKAILCKTLDEFCKELDGVLDTK